MASSSAPPSSPEVGAALVHPRSILRTTRDTSASPAPPPCRPGRSRLVCRGVEHILLARAFHPGRSPPLALEARDLLVSHPGSQGASPARPPSGALARRLVGRAGKDGEDGVHAPALELLDGEDVLEEHVVAVRRVGLEVGKGGERRLGEDGEEDARAEEAVGKALLPRLAVLEAYVPTLTLRSMSL